MVAAARAGSRGSDDSAPEAHPVLRRASVHRGILERAPGQHMEAVLVELERLPALRLRRVLAVGGGAALAAATALAVMGWPGHERPCRGAEARLAGIWDDPVRAGLRRAFVATGGRRGGADLVGAVGERAGVERRPGRLGESDGQPARGLERGPSME